MLAALAGTTNSAAQLSDSLPKITATLEIRPRFEYRSNFSPTINDSVQNEFSATQRNRFTVSFTYKNLLLHSSLQEIHLWGRNNKISAIGSINAYELYLQHQVSRKLLVKLGRQSVLLDNGRIFSDAPWAQQGRSHEGLRATYTNTRLTSDIFALFTRKYKPLFDKRFSPVNEHNYQSLFIHHLRYQPSDHLSFTTINALDFFRSSSNIHYHRFTTGGRIAYEKGSVYSTINAYLQLGRNNTLKKLNAYYLQPEIKINLLPVSLRLGAEILSGEKETGPNISRNFDVLYGVAWKFMGNMNFFTKFPNDVGGKGLVNPYGFVLLQLNKQLLLRTDAHLFYTQYSLMDSGGNELNKYLGFENDISFKYNLSKKLELNGGLSYYLGSGAMETLGKLPDHGKIALWSYLMVSYNFQY